MLSKLKHSSDYKEVKHHEYVYIMVIDFEELYGARHVHTPKSTWQVKILIAKKIQIWVNIVNNVVVYIDNLY